jgi:hypothetical protein
MEILKPVWREPNADELAIRQDAHFDAVIDSAGLICEHYAEDALDEADHQLRPCPACVGAVTTVLAHWLNRIRIAGFRAGEKSSRLQTAVMVSLPDAYKVASSVLDPDLTVAMNGYGTL